jgi:hypothetical protein
VGGPSPAEQLAGPLGADNLGQFCVVVVDHLVYFSSASALLEMPSKSA